MFFFSRLQLIYGARFSAQWPEEQSLQHARREWAGHIDRLTWPELELALERAKNRLVEGDTDFYWPDVGRILGLGKSSRCAAHRVFQPALPEGDSLKQARRVKGRKAMAGIWSVLGGRHAQ